MTVIAPLNSNSSLACEPVSFLKLSLDQSASPRNPEHPWALLAILRFGLALIVLGSHAPVAGFHCAPLEWLATLGPQQAIIAFFLISGYSIGHSVQKEPDGYLKRRVFRIYPVYLSCLAVGLLPYLWCRDWVTVGNGVIGLPPLRSTLLPSLLLVQCLGWPVAGVLGSAWSLSIEWLFYLVAPLLVRTRTLAIIAATIVSAAAMLIYPHVASISALPYRSLPYGLPVLIAGWAWLAGFLLHRKHGDRRLQIAVLLLAATVSLASTDRYFVKPGVFVIALAVATICFGGKMRMAREPAKLFSYLGDLSYPLYLLHLPVYILIYNRWHATSWIIYIGATFALSAVILHGVDKPLRVLGRRKASPSDAEMSGTSRSAARLLNVWT